MLLRIQRQHGGFIVALDLGWPDRDAHAETLLDKSEHLHSLLPDTKKACLGEALCGEITSPSGLGFAVKLLAGGDGFPERIEILGSGGVGDLVFGLKARLLQDEIAIDETLDGFVARVWACVFAVGQKSGEATLLIDIAVENEFTIHDGDDSIELRAGNGGQLRVGSLRLRHGIWHRVSLGCTLCVQCRGEEARQDEQHREDAKLVLAELEVACHVV